MSLRSSATLPSSPIVQTGIPQNDAGEKSSRAPVLLPAPKASLQRTLNPEVPNPQAQGLAVASAKQPELSAKTRGAGIEDFFGGVVDFFAKIFARKATIPPQYHGSYVGLSPLLVRRGASFEDAQMRFSVNKEGLTMPVRFQGSEQEFQAHFDNEWFFKSNFLKPPCYAVGQHESPEDGTVAGFFFCFAPDQEANKAAAEDSVWLGDEEEHYRAEMILGEGIPLSLGHYIEDGDQATERLQALYHELRGTFDNPEIKTDSEEKGRSSDLVSIDLEEARQIMEQGSENNKLETLRLATANLWTAGVEEISERLALLDRALVDSSPAVRNAAIRVFQLDLRNTQGVDRVIDFLSRAENHQDAPKLKYNDIRLLQNAVESASILLYEAADYLRTAQKLEAAFGTHDLDEIHERTQGNIEAKYIDEMGEIQNAKRYEGRAWTPEHRSKLRNALESVVAMGEKVSLATRTEALAALRQY